MSDGDQSEASGWGEIDWTREGYEDLIRRVVPEYDEQESLMAEAVRAALPSAGRGPFRILELGSGTGTLSRFLLKVFPEAELTALDVSPAMVAECQEVLACFGARVRVVEAGLATADLGEGYQAVVSRLAIHHLPHAEKRALFDRVLTALAPGGVFVDSDMIAGENEAEAAAILDEWRAYMVSRGDDPAEWEEWLVGDDDFPGSAQGRLTWLREAGFADVQIIWKRANFAIIRALKPRGSSGGEDAGG